MKVLALINRVDGVRVDTMKNFLTPSVLIVMLSLLTPAQNKALKKQSPSKKDEATTVEQQLIKLEQEGAEAAKNKVNAEVIFNRVLSEDWFFTGPHGRVQNREQVIEAVKSNSDSIARTEFFDIKVRVYGNTAIVTGGASEIGTRSSGQAYVEDYRWMDIFVKRKGRWQAVVSQATLLPSRYAPKK